MRSRGREVNLYLQVELYSTWGGTMTTNNYVAPIFHWEILNGSYSYSTYISKGSLSHINGVRPSLLELQLVGD